MITTYRLVKHQRQLTKDTTDPDRARTLVALATAWENATKVEDYKVIAVTLKVIAHIYDPIIPGGARMGDLDRIPTAPQVTIGLRRTFSEVAQAVTMGGRDDAIDGFENLYSHLADHFGDNVAEDTAGMVLSQVYGSPSIP